MYKLGLPALALAAGLAAPAAHAQLPPTISSHATKCREAGATPSGAFHFSEYRVTRSGTAGSGLLLCPVDFVQSTWNLNVTARVMDTMPASNLSCSLLLKNQDGTTLQYQTRWTTGSSEEVRAFQFAMPADTSMFAVLSCLMPANVGETYTKLFGYSAT